MIYAKFGCESCNITASVPQWTTIPFCRKCMRDMDFIEDEIVLTAKDRSATRRGNA